MAKDILMPALSPSMTEGNLVEWLKKEGDVIKAGDVIATVQTDKSAMDLEAFDSGILRKIIVVAGTTVPVNARIGIIGTKDEVIDLSTPAAPAPTPVAAESAHTPPPAPAKPHAEKPAAPVESPKELLAAAHEELARIKASPLAKKVAAESGVNLAQVNGTGPGGRIVRDDVVAAATAKASAPVTPAPKETGKPAATPAPALVDSRIKLSPMRAVIAKRLLESKTTIPHFYLEIEVNAKPMMDLRAQINDALTDRNIKVSFNDIALKAAAEAIRRVPGVNASYEGEYIRTFADVNLAFAVAIPDGLITPVIRQAQIKSLVQISLDAKSLAGKAREGKLKPDEYTGGTFCLSNLGSYGIDRFSAIINPPQAGILAVGNIVKKPVVDEHDQIVVGHRQVYTLSCDHRVIDGAVGADFLKAFKDVLEKPTLLLL